MSELELLKNGDRQLLQGMYSDCFRTISSWIRKNKGNEADAEDVFHEAIVTVYQKARKNDLTLTCKLSTFLFSVSKNVWLHQLRSRRRHNKIDQQMQQYDLLTDHLTGYQLYADGEIQSLFSSSFESLCPECRTLLTHFFDGLSITAIAKKMNLPNTNVTRKKKFRCKNKLVAMIRNRPEFPELSQN
ncbi:MAG: RNA polymerase sigma factor [Cyclobacteriaceae bacterium]